MSTSQPATPLSALADKWPSAIVAREDVGQFTGGVLTPKTMANLDSKGEGPTGTICIGKKVAYPVPNLIAWLEGKTQARRSQVAGGGGAV